MHTAFEKESLGRENSRNVMSHVSITIISARHMISEARSIDTGSEKSEFDDVDDCVMVFRAIASRDQMADCHVKGDGEVGVAGPGVILVVASCGI